MNQMKKKNSGSNDELSEEKNFLLPTQTFSTFFIKKEFACLFLFPSLFNCFSFCMYMFSFFICLFLLLLFHLFLLLVLLLFQLLPHFLPHHLFSSSAYHSNHMLANRFTPKNKIFHLFLWPHPSQ